MTRLRTTHLHDPGLHILLSRTYLSWFKQPMYPWETTTVTLPSTPASSTTIARLSLMNFMSSHGACWREAPNIRALFSNKDSADEEHYPYNNFAVHYHDVCFGLVCERQIKNDWAKRWDTGEAFTSRGRPPLHFREQRLLQPNFVGLKRHDGYFSEDVLSKDGWGVVTEKLEVIEVDDLDTEVTQPKKAAKIAGCSTSHRKRKNE